MNSFQQFIDYMFKITESYQLEEGAKSSAISIAALIAKHLLRAFQSLETEGESHASSAVREIENKFVPLLNKAVRKINGYTSDIEEEILIGLNSSSVLSNYEQSYKKSNTLFPLSSSYALSLEKKLANNEITLEDLGLLTKKEKGFFKGYIFNFEEAKKKNI